MVIGFIGDEFKSEDNVKNHISNYATDVLETIEDFKKEYGENYTGKIFKITIEEVKE